MVAKACGVLRKMLDEAVSEGNERRARAVAKAMASLKCPHPRAHGPKTTTVPTHPS